MDRKKGLERRTALKQGEKRLKRTTALKQGDKPLERTNLAQGDSQLTRSAMKPGKRRKRERSPEERDAMAAWVHAVMQGKTQCACGCGRTPDEAHHVIRQQVLERLARALGGRYESVVWDPRLGMALAAHCHAQHTARADRVAGERVPLQAWVAAAGLDAALEAAGRPCTATIELLREHPLVAS